MTQFNNPRQLAKGRHNLTTANSQQKEDTVYNSKRLAKRKTQFNNSKQLSKEKIPRKQSIRISNLFNWSYMKVQYFKQRRSGTWYRFKKNAAIRKIYIRIRRRYKKEKVAAALFTRQNSHQLRSTNYRPSKQF